MAIDWNKARQAMTSDDAYRGTGVSRPRRAPTYGGSQGRGGQGNIRRVSRQPGIAEANIRPRGGGIFDAIRSKGKKFVHPGLEMMGKFGDLASGAMRGSRLHQSYQDDLGRVAGHKEWEKDKTKTPAVGKKILLQYLLNEYFNKYCFLPFIYLLNMYTTTFIPVENILTFSPVEQWYEFT